MGLKAYPAHYSVDLQIDVYTDKIEMSFKRLKYYHKRKLTCGM